MALITRILESADGTQQIAIFDTEQQSIGSDLGLFVDMEGKDKIAPANRCDTYVQLGKLIFIGICRTAM